jgi:uncharacterized protein (TIGR00369 family)
VTIPSDIEGLNALGRGYLPGHLGIEIMTWADGEVTARLPVRRELFAPNGYIHAASVVALADTLCGYGCASTLPEGAAGFTTVELKANFLGTARDGELTGRAVRVHAGRSTQLWDATVTAAGGKTVALFRCTQLVLWPR